MTLSEYSQLKQYIIFSVGTNERHSEILSSLKEFFRDSINSVRRFEQITSIGHLLRVLEIRDLLSEDNVECLKNIALRLPNSQDVMQRITDYERCHVPREYGNYYTASTQNQKKEPEDSFITSSPLTSNLSKRKKQRIFETIIEEIGSFWRDLARNLKIRECVIDDIDFQNKTLAIKATKIMEAYEYKADPQRWFFVLCDALEKTRRKDLVRSIQEIMAMNI
ncbi:uncharacterized protein LOC110378975 [Helicoverpa armigera]|nr:uncharacterized protein LOC110378975 [Helicoverpa armigera]XP_047020029.1 uncharacterized protein LOC124630272 [Helicoverpa zea]